MSSPPGFARDDPYQRLEKVLFLNYSSLIDPVLGNLRAYIPEFSGMKAGDAVLDIGCGTGAQAFHYARKGISAVGIDTDVNMIKTAERGKRKLGLRNVSFQIADALSLPFQDGLFDFVSASLVLHTLERASRDKAIAEMKRVVKREGILIFADFRIPLPGNVYSYLVKALEFFAGREHYRNSKDYITQGGLDGLLERNRLQIDKRGHLKAGIITVIKTHSATTQ